MSEIEYSLVPPLHTGGGTVPEHWECTLIASDGQRLTHHGDTKPQALSNCKDLLSDYETFIHLPILEQLRAYATEGNKRWNPYKAIEVMAKLIIEHSNVEPVEGGKKV